MLPVLSRKRKIGVEGCIYGFLPTYLRDVGVSEPETRTARATDRHTGTEAKGLRLHFHYVVNYRFRGKSRL